MFAMKHRPNFQLSIFIQIPIAAAVHNVCGWHRTFCCATRDA